MNAPTDQLPVYRGAMLAVLLQWSVRLIGLVSVVLLARLLDPADFGMIAIAMTAVALVELMWMTGPRQALLRTPDPERAHYDTAWTIQLLVFALMTIVMIAVVAPLAADFYGQPALAAVLAALGFRFLLIGLVNIGVVDFERKLEFGKDLQMRVGARLAALAVTVVAALTLRNYWALVIGLLAQSLFFAIASYIVHPYRPRLSIAKRGELLGTSLWIFVSATAQTVQQQIERLVIGRFGSPHVVGLYSVSKDLASIFTQEIATALNRVTFVTVAHAERPLSESPDQIARLLGAYAMIAAPLALGLAATAPDAIRVLLGDKWLAAAPLLAIVAVYSGINAVYKLIASVLLASGYARGGALLSSGGALLAIVAVSAVGYLYRSPVTVAWAAFGVHFAMLGHGIVVLARLSGSTSARLAVAVLRPFLAGAAMFLVIVLASLATPAPLITLALNVTLGTAVYFAALMLIWAAAGRPEGAESELIRLLSRFRRGAAASG